MRRQEDSMKASERMQAIKFLRDHVIGKTVYATPLTTYTDEGRVMVVSDDQTFFSNLVETMDGFGYDLTAVARGTRYERDKAGQFEHPEGSLIAVRVYRYEITERKSSGKLVGFARYISSTNTQPDPFSGTIFVTRMWLEGGALVVQDAQAGYADLVGAGGTAKPGAIDGKYRYTIEKDKLVLHYEQTNFDVDPETLRKTPRADKFPVQISNEIEFPPFAAA
jgi:hypothetical protein